MVSFCTVCASEFKYYPSTKSGLYCSRDCMWKDPAYLEKNKKINLGRIHNDAFREKVSKRMKGIPHKPESIKLRTEKMKVTKARQYQERIDKDPTIITFRAEAKNIRESSRSKKWRKAIHERDKVCVMCGSSKSLEVDHIIPFASMLDEAYITGNFSGLFDLENGRLLCFQCHKNTDSFNRFKKHQIEFRLQDALRQHWKQLGEPDTFKIYYDKAVEHFINSVKEKLE